MNMYVFLNTIFKGTICNIDTERFKWEPLSKFTNHNTGESGLTRVARLARLWTNKVARWAECKMIFWEELSYCIWTMTSDSQSYTVGLSADAFVCKPAHMANHNKSSDREVKFQTNFSKRTYWLYYCGQRSRYLDKACCLHLGWHNSFLLRFLIQLLHIVYFFKCHGMYWSYAPQY